MTHLLRFSPALVGIALVAAAAAHRWMLGDPGYTKSWLIRLEMALLLSLLVLVFAQVLYAAGSLFARKWGELLVTLALLVLSFILLLAALSIDSPTLLYAT